MSFGRTFTSRRRTNAAQVEERRTPLQLSMDELAQKLSIISFGVIGVICLIGVLQQRSWLEMFTIGGQHACSRTRRAVLTVQTQFLSPLLRFRRACPLLRR
jgi:hypothetical protein